MKNKPRVHFFGNSPLQALLERVGVGVGVELVVSGGYLWRMVWGVRVGAGVTWAIPIQRGVPHNSWQTRSLEIPGPCTASRHLTGSKEGSGTGTGANRIKGKAPHRNWCQQDQRRGLTQEMVPTGSKEWPCTGAGANRVKGVARHSPFSSRYNSVL